MKKQILILCTGNSCRSQMAEGLVNHFLGDQWQAFSAGTHPSRLNPYAARVMDEIGVDISSQQSEGVDVYLEQDFDWIITVCGDAEKKCPTFPGKANRIHIGFNDPVNIVGSDEEIMDAFRSVRDDIKNRLLSFLKEK